MAKVYFSNFSKQMYSYIDELIERGLINNRDIILFGLNSSSYVIRDYLNKKNISISAYIDNSEKKRLQSKENVPTYSPEEMAKYYGKRAVILITSKYYLEMKKQLEGLGYEEAKDFFQVIDVNDLEQYVDFSDVQDMNEISVEELKIIQLKLLKIVKSVCEKYNLRYYLCGGTLIGAVRHKGYIPWDDDIDIAMPMNDFKEFINIVNTKTKYTVLNAYDYPEIYHPFYARIIYPDTIIKTWDYPYMSSLGINIDIFPLYGFPESKEELERFADKLETLNVEFNEEFIKYPKPTKRYYDLQKQILNLMDIYEFDKSTNIAYLLSQYKRKEIMPRAIYNGYIMREFEGELYPIATGYDDYLKRLFGKDYMKLPDEKERNSVHHFRAFVKNNLI